MLAEFLQALVEIGYEIFRFVRAIAAWGVILFVIIMIGELFRCS
jgi:hypothetical protein